MQILQINDTTSVKLPNGPVGISFSGGADSTILAYLALTQLSEPVHLITMGTFDRGLSQIKTSADVIERLYEVTNNSNIVCHIACEPDAKRGIKNLFKLPKKLLYDDRIINSLMTGTNTDPPDEVWQEFPETDRSAKMMLERQRGVSKPVKVGPGWYCPITNLDKQDITKLYYDHNILESLFPYTKSCSTDYNEPECGVCWFCKEREWGLRFTK